MHYISGHITSKYLWRWNDNKMSARKFIPLGNWGTWCLHSLLEVHVFPFDGSESKPLRFQYKLCSFPLKNQTQFVSKMPFCSVFYFLKRCPLWAKRGNSVCAIHNWPPPLICTGRFLPFLRWMIFYRCIPQTLLIFFFSASDLFLTSWVLLPLKCIPSASVTYLFLRYDPHVQSDLWISCY